MTTENNQKITLSRELLIYIPAYNCAKYIAGVLDEIPDELLQLAEVVIIDNRSTDDTVERIKQAMSAKSWAAPVHLVQPPENLGYSGSQKLAYSIVLDSPCVKRVIMLHGDGQYPPELLEEFLPYLGSEYGIAYGFRDKSSYPTKEETPAGTYRIIKMLSALESFATGHGRKEWHSGFVMYSRDFLSRVKLHQLTDTYHFDGHMQFVSGELGEKVKAIPIWKRYKNYEQLKGLNRLTYIFHVLRLMVLFRIMGSGQSDDEDGSIPLEYSILAMAGGSTDEANQ
jgi:glycosyltransferase involved in cell wall biosynthesis